MCTCPGATAGNKELRKNPCLEGIHRYLLGIQSLLIIGGSPPSKMQLDVMLLSALYIRGRCLEHLPKGCSGSSPRTVLSWAGKFHQRSPAAQPRPLKGRGAQVTDSSLAVGLPAPGDILHAGSCSLCLSHWISPEERRQKDVIASNFKHFCIYLHYWCFLLQTLKSSPRQEEFCIQITSVPVD